MDANKEMAIDKEASIDPTEFRDFRQLKNQPGDTTRDSIIKEVKSFFRNSGVEINDAEIEEKYSIFGRESELDINVMKPKELWEAIRDEKAESVDNVNENEKILKDIVELKESAISIGKENIDHEKMWDRIWIDAPFTIARQLGVEEGDVINACQRLGITDRLQKMADEKPDVQIAKELGVSRDVVRFRKASLGICSQWKKRTEDVQVCTDEPSTPFNERANKEEIKMRMFEKSIPSVARENGISVGQLIEYCRDSGIIDELQEMADGNPKTLIAAKFNVSRDVISERFQILGIKTYDSTKWNQKGARDNIITEKQRTNASPRRMDDLDRKELIKLIFEMTVERTCKKFMISKDTFIQQLKEIGIYQELQRLVREEPLTKIAVKFQSDQWTVARRMKELGLEGRLDTLNQLSEDDEGNRLPTPIVVRNFATHMKSIVFTDAFLDENGLHQGDTPTFSMVREHHSDVLWAMYRAGVKYNDVLLEMGYQITRKPDRWKHLDFDDDGKPLSHEETLDRAAAELFVHVIPDLREKGIIKEGEIPTYDTVNMYMSAFINAIKNRYLTFNDVRERAGLGVKHAVGKWRFFHYDEQGNMRTADEALEVAAKFLNDNIVNQDFKRKYGLFVSKSFPDRTKLPADFVSAVRYYGMQINDVIEKAGWEPNDMDISVFIGSWMHASMERETMEHCVSDKGANAFHEIYLKQNNDKNYDDSVCTVSRCDIIIANDKKFSELSPSSKEFAETNPDIKFIVLDFMLTNDGEYFDDHCFRGYQNEKRCLILISLTENEEVQIPDEAPFRENISTMNPAQFMSLLGFSGARRNRISKIVESTEKAFWDEGLRKKMAFFARRDLWFMKTAYGNCGDRFRGFVKSHPEFDVSS